jgi:transcriptional regulator with XRE-family HTH domain
MEYSPRYDQFRALLRAIREEAGLSQLALAKKLGKPQSFVCKSEIGERFVDFLETLDFCAACNVPLTIFTERLEHVTPQEKAGGKPKRRNLRKTVKAG